MSEQIFTVLRRKFLLRVHNAKLFSYFSTKTYVVGTQKNCLNETVLLSTKTYVKTPVKLVGKKIFTILRSKFLFRPK